MMKKRAKILALVCLTCLTVGIAFSGSLSAAETTQTDEAATTLEFVNEYKSAGSYTWDITKAIEGRPLRKGEQFVFSIEAEDGAPLPRNAGGEAVSNYTMEITSDEEGSYAATRSLPAIPFTNADLGNAPSKTFTYRIAENPGSEEYMAYAPGKKTLTLQAVDQGDGTITVTRVSENGDTDTFFTNIYARTCSAAVTKTWNDADNQDGKRPDELLAELHRVVTRTLGVPADGQTEDVIVTDGVSLSRENSWTHREDGLPCWDRWGNAYSYYWQEYVLQGERKIYPSWDEHTIVFNGADYFCEAVTTENTESAVPLTATNLSNRHEPEVTEATVRKVWDDRNDEQGMRPECITVKLYANNRPTGLAVKLGTDPTFINDDGTGIYSSVGYVSGGAGAEKEDNDPFTATIARLPAYVAGVRQVYTWMECDDATDRNGNGKSLANDLYYSAADYNIAGDTTTITNRYDTQLTSLTLLKVWDDAEDRNSIRPESVQVTLRAVNGDYEQEFTLNSENNWTVVATDLPRILNGQVLKYEWAESPLPNGYILTDGNGDPVDAVDADADGERTATMVNKLPMGTLKVTKKMTADDGKIQPEGRFFEFTVTRKTADGTTEYVTPDGKIGTERTVNRIQAGETVTFMHLSLGTYQVTELGTENGGSAQIENYTLAAETENSSEAVLDTDGSETVITLENAYTRKRGTLTVTKKVTGAKEADKTGRKYRIRVKDSDGEYYLTDGTAAAADKAWTTVSEDSTAVWKDLPFGTYTVEEDTESASIERYIIDEEHSETKAEIRLADNNNGEASATLRNTYLPLLGAIEITKQITGTDVTNEFNALRIRIRGPEEFDLTVTYDMFRDGKYTIREIPDGEYIIEEINAAEISARLILRGDSVTTVQAVVTRGNTTAVKLVNNYDIVTTSATVRKVWDDNNNQDGMRPDSIVMILSNGREAELNAENGWTATIDNLPMYDEAGKFITYTWTEPEIKGYYQQSVTKEGVETLFVNRHTPETVSATVTKVWDDADNAAGLRPANLRVRLSNGSIYYLNERNGWTVTVEGLPAYEYGAPIVYTWSEQSVLGYTSTSRTEGAVTTFTNHFFGELCPEYEGRKVIRLRNNSLIIIEDLPTPLGLGGIINHVGDTFE